MFQSRFFPIAISVMGLASAGPVSAQNIATFAGNGTLSFSGDGGAAISAGLNAPKGLAIDAAGSIYIADQNNFRVRKVSTTGVITTVAGNGVNTFAGDGGPATSASISDVSSIAFDPSGNMYIGDASNRRIRKVTAGIITTIAGTGIEGFTGDGGPATSAQIGRAVAMVVDAAGNLYFADSTRERIRRINTGGIISTVAGNGVAAFAGDGGQATAASIATPLGIALDSAGNLYIADADNNRVRKVATSGVITTVAGTGGTAFNGDGGAATSANLNIPSDVAVDSSGNLYIGDAGNNRVRKVANGTITTVAGGATNGFSGDGGPATSALLDYPWALLVTPNGSLYISDLHNSRVRDILSAVQAPSFTSSAVVNGASFTSGLNVAAGGIVSIFGNNIADAPSVAGVVPLPGTLGQTSVFFNGNPAPLFFVSSGQLNAQIPTNVGPGPVQVQITKGSLSSAAQTITLSTYSPGIFLADQTGTGTVFHNLPFTLVTASSPAHTGEVVVILCTGLGPVTPAVPAGTSPGNSQTTPTAATATIGGVPAQVTYSGMAPTLVGVYQVNVTIPQGLGTGSKSLQISIGAVTSNAVNVAVAP
jgi:uncharacterized protein (TIGR03437 family)